MSSDVQLVQSFYDDISALFEAFDPNVEWHEMQGTEYGGVYSSAAAVMENVFGRIASQWDGFAAVPTMILAATDGWVAATGRYRGTFKPTGKTLDCDFAHFYKLRGGRIVEFRQYTDSALWNEAMS